MIESAGIGERFRLLGGIAPGKLADLYSSADIFVMPSIVDVKGEYETFGTALAEALSFSLPAIAFASGALPELIEPGVDGILVEERDYKSLAENIKILLRNPVQASKLGREGRIKIESRFDPSKQAEKLLAIYERVIESNRK